MCFSATASFVAGGALAGLGFANKPKIIHPTDLPLAAIPFIFSVQQIIEGFVWMGEGASWQIYFAYAFVIIAFLFWPAVVPYAFYMQETSERSRRQILYLIPLGLLVSGYLTFFLITNPLHFDSNCCNHIQYYYNVFGEHYVMALYLFATVLPPLLSSSRWLNFFGLSLGIAYLVSFFLYFQGLFSVWCFFAAILSFLILMHFKERK